tara:strand:+ start:1386 stop:1772 length:387 start_codon:yes stop_codon:yes gene_type:complete
MPDERFLAALKRIRADIAAGRKFEAADSDALGDKYNACSWGTCTRLPEHWPDTEDHLWPDQFVKHGRVAPLYHRDGQHCPMDKEPPKDGHTFGCFHRCRVFGKGKTPDREATLKLFDAAIEAMERKLG